MKQKKEKKPWSKKKKIIVGVVAFFIIGGIASSGSTEKEKEKNIPVSTQQTSEENKPEPESNPEENKPIEPIETKPTESEIEIYNYYNDLLNAEYQYDDPSFQELAEYFSISESEAEKSYTSFSQTYLDDKHEKECDQATAEKFNISIEEVTKIWTKVFSYQNKDSNSMKAEIESLVKNEFGESNFIEVNYVPENNFLLIKARASDNLSNEMILRSMYLNIKNLLKELEDLENINIDFNIVYPSGSNTDDIALKATYNWNTRKDIDFNNFLTEDVPTKADDLWIHP